MTFLVRRLLVLLVLAAFAAGCTTTNNGGPGGDGNGTPSTTATASPPAQMSNTEARTLLTSAASDMPDRFGMHMVVRANGSDAMTMDGAFDNATGEAYIEISGDASAFGPEAAATGAEFFEQGLAIYTTKEGSLYLANNTAFVFPPDEGDGSLVPPPSQSPFSNFVDPSNSFETFDDNVTVHSVTPTVYKGKPAIRMEVSTVDDEAGVTNATVIVWTSPSRLAHMETTLPEQGDEENPLSGATALIDFSYGDDVTITVPASAQRALGLGYKSNKNAFMGGGDEPTVWTFHRSGGIALSEVEVQVKGEMGMDGDDEGTPDYAKMPTLWTMKLSDGSKTQDGVTIAFADKDNDGKVSRNDTLTITSSSDSWEAPNVVLYDTVSGTYVVPGVEMALLLGALVALAIVLRRK